MARRNKSIVEGLVEASSKLPWWAGVVFALAAYLWLHGLAGSEVTAVAQPGKTGEFVNHTIFNTLASVGQYLLPAAFLLGAAVSAYGRYQSRALHDRATASHDKGALNEMSWQHFEALVAEAFRRKGYAVTRTGVGGVDGRIDAVLKMTGEVFLVQCKQWRALKVGVTTVRELYGVMVEKGAAGGFVVTSGVFTDEALAFAEGKHIKLMDGKALHALIRGVSVPARIFRDPLSVMTTGAPFCPECQSRMVKRKAKPGGNPGQMFWNCTWHPDCKGTRPA